MIACEASKAGRAANEGKLLLDQLMLPVKDATGQDTTPSNRKLHVASVEETLAMVQQRKLRCDELIEVRRLKLQQLLHLRTCEHDAEQVSLEECNVRCLRVGVQDLVCGGDKNL